jgi:hypothetical protein
MTRKANVHAHSSLFGIRIVALPAAIDLCVGILPASTTALRFAPDEVLLLPELILGQGLLKVGPESGLSGDGSEFSLLDVNPSGLDLTGYQDSDEDPEDFDDDDRLEMALEILLGEDPSVIVETDTGMSAMMFSRTEYDRLIASRVEWQLPSTKPYLSQGKFLGVPVKLYATNDEALVICLTAYVHELAERVR